MWREGTGTIIMVVMAMDPILPTVTTLDLIMETIAAATTNSALIRDTMGTTLVLTLDLIMAHTADQRFPFTSPPKDHPLETIVDRISRLDPATKPLKDRHVVLAPCPDPDRTARRRTARGHTLGERKRAWEPRERARKSARRAGGSMENMAMDMDNMEAIVDRRGQHLRFL